MSRGRFGKELKGMIEGKTPTNVYFVATAPWGLFESIENFSRTTSGLGNFSLATIALYVHDQRSMVVDLLSFSLRLVSGPQFSTAVQLLSELGLLLIVFELPEEAITFSFAPASREDEPMASPHLEEGPALVGNSETAETCGCLVRLNSQQLDDALNDPGIVVTRGAPCVDAIYNRAPRYSEVCQRSVRFSF